MKQWQRKLDFDRPTLEMLTFNNIYTDSRRDFRWRFCPIMDRKVLVASVYTILCYECADDVEDREFPLTEEGFGESKKWIQEKFSEYVKNNKDLD